MSNMPRRRKSESELPLLEIPSPRSSTSSEERIRKSNDLLAKQGAISQAPVGPAFLRFWRKNDPGFRPDDIATQPSVFDDENLAQYFKPSQQYENLHRFDPSERWTWAEELSVIRKLDWRVTAFACTAFFALDLPRTNITQANTDNFLDDLELNTNDYNLGNALFKTAFLISELPSQLISKRLGPDVWVPCQMILWSLVSGSQFWLSGKTSFLFTRVLIGALQGGFIPDLILYMSYFFTGRELPWRLALFWFSNRITAIASPLMAFGLLHLQGLHGHEGWRWLFLIEGLVTFVIGSWAMFQMVPSPTQTVAWWRPKGWFTVREEKIIVNRILRDDPSKGDMHNREGLTPAMLWDSLCDFDLWPLYLIGLTYAIPVQPAEQYFTLILRDMGFGTYESNLLTIPASVGATINMLICTPLFEYLNQRTAYGIFAQIWVLPCVIALEFLPWNPSQTWARYAVITTLIAYPYPHAMQVAWCSRISNSVRTRTVSAALYNMFVQTHGIISANIYREDDKPAYRRGNKWLIFVALLNIGIYIFAKVYYVRRNEKRRRKWNALTPEEQKVYLETTTDQGNKRLDFLFVS